MYILNICILLHRYILVNGANWAQLAGERAQTVVKPYIPQKFYNNAQTLKRQMWSARWGHAVVVLNDTSAYRNDMTMEQNSQRAMTLVPKLLLLGGDDYTTDEDNDPSGGLRNDVWYSELSSRSDSTWKNRKERRNGMKSEVVVTSNMIWHQSHAGNEAPIFWPRGHPREGYPMTYDDWIHCQDTSYEDKSKQSKWYDAVFESNYIWSPRRGHAAAVANGAVFVIGGRSREQASMDDQRITTDISDSKAGSSTFQSKVQQTTVLKNDIWVSRDGLGKTWSLVTLGCRDQQEDVLFRTELWSGGSKEPKRFAGSSFSACEKSSDCYGEAVCKFVKGSSNKVCTCPFFGVREHHSISVQHRYFKKKDNETFSEDYIYLVGGFTHVRQKFCNGLACGSRGTYRMALDDAWVSNNGVKWVQIRPASGNSAYKARGGHAGILIHANLFRRQRIDTLWIVGGEIVGPSIQSEFLNDVWNVNLSTEPCCQRGNACGEDSQHLLKSDIGNCLPNITDWYRSGISTAWGGRMGHVVIHEPPSSLNAFVDYIYLIGGKNKSSVQSDVWSLDASAGLSWKLDFASPSVVEPTSKSTNPYQFYYDMNSDIKSIVHMHLPVTKRMVDEVFIPPAAIPLIRDEDVHHLKNAGVFRFTDLRNANQRTILKLRGFDFPGNPKTAVKDICYLKTLIESFEAKCSVDMERDHSNSEIAHCHSADDFDNCVAKTWDGCKPLAGLSYMNVHGIGTVTVPAEQPELLAVMENMSCKQTPGPRFLSAGQYIDGKVLLFGGKGSNSRTLYQDVWSRDSAPPKATMKMKPKSRSSQSKFLFECDEDGASQFEYKLFDLIERLDVTPWLKATIGEVVDISWLDSKKGGPGSGWYTLYLRAIDPSGNRDTYFSKNTNAYTWLYIEPLPWGKIIGSVFAIISLLTLGYLEYRRRERKAALERYAQRRKRRKVRLREEKDNWSEFYENQVPVFSSKRDVRQGKKSMEKNTKQARRRNSRKQRE